MKLSYLLLPIFLFSCSSASKEDKAQKLASDYLYKTLPDFKSYEAMEFGKIDSFYNQLDDDTAYTKSTRMLDIYEIQSDHANQMVDIIKDSPFKREEDKKYYQEAADYKNKVDSIKSEIESMKARFKSEFSGWEMDHKFRAKDPKGVSAINNYKFIYDKNMDSVILVKELN